jgi:hypothetical protein
MADKTLVPVVQKEVIFYGDVITAVQVNENGRTQILIPLRPLCDHLELSWSGQLQRLKRDLVLASELRSVFVTQVEPGRSSDAAETEATREMICLPLDFLNGWLFGVNARRVKDSVRQQFVRYQRECHRALFEAFNEGRLTTEPGFDELLASDTPAAQAYKMAAAIMKMARQQLILEARLESHSSQLVNHEQRLEEIEATLGDPGRFVTPDQAMQLSQAIKAIATEIEKRTRKNEYGAIYGQLYREFGITSYKQLPASKFNQAMEWLANWYKRISGSTGGEMPF